MTDAWDRMEARYFAGLGVNRDVRVPALLNLILYAWGANVWWALAPAMAVHGWQRQVLWATSFFLAYMALRSLAVIHASAAWLDRLALARHIGPGHRRADLAGRRRAELHLSPLNRIKARRGQRWRHDDQ